MLVSKLSARISSKTEAHWLCTCMSAMLYYTLKVSITLFALYLINPNLVMMVYELAFPSSASSCCTPGMASQWISAGLCIREFVCVYVLWRCVSQALGSSSFVLCLLEEVYRCCPRHMTTAHCMCRIANHLPGVKNSSPSTTTGSSSESELSTNSMSSSSSSSTTCLVFTLFIASAKCLLTRSILPYACCACLTARLRSYVLACVSTVCPIAVANSSREGPPSISSPQINPIVICLQFCQR